MVFTVVVGCTKSREPAATEIPPVLPANEPYVPGDETPLAPTKAGYVLSPIPGVSAETPKAPDYTDYVGASN